MIFKTTRKLQWRGESIFSFSSSTSLCLFFLPNFIASFQLVSSSLSLSFFARSHSLCIIFPSSLSPVFYLSFPFSSFFPSYHCAPSNFLSLCVSIMCSHSSLSLSLFLLRLKNSWVMNLGLKLRHGTFSKSGKVSRKIKKSFFLSKKMEIKKICSSSFQS